MDVPSIATVCRATNSLLRQTIWTNVTFRARLRSRLDENTPSACILPKSGRCGSFGIGEMLSEEAIEQRALTCAFQADAHYFNAMPTRKLRRAPII